MHISTRIIIFEVIALIILAVLIAMGFSPSAFLPRQWHLLFHILGAIMFIGNILVGALWITFTGISASSTVAHFSSRTLNWADVVFTAPGAFLLLYNGILIAEPFGGLWTASWMRWSFLLFSLSGAIWCFLLLPLQEFMIRHSAEFESHTEPSDSFQRISFFYAFPGILTSILVLVALGLMVLKPV